MGEHPVFAVVGHPNKGKSSVVSSLTQNDQVEISPVSGTTRAAQHFTLCLDDRVLFELVDTPGFQRAAGCLAWLREERVTADRRPERIRAFIEHFAHGDRFRDEVALLHPIAAGAGIVYVVDGSLPYSPEYEAEMEILRWSGRPRLALINPIGGDAFVTQWQRALNQYFGLVRLFDPLRATFEQHLQLLRAFGQLDPERIGTFDRAIERLQHHRRLKLEQGARIVVDTLHRLLTHSQPLPPQEEADAALGRFNARLNGIEREGRQALEALFLHHRLKPEIVHLRVHHHELMAREHWSDWGLGRGRLTLVGAGAGAAVGAAFDVGSGGLTGVAATLGGGLLGGLSGWLGEESASGWLREHLPDWALGEGDGGPRLGPVADPNFPFVILGRALAHARVTLQRSHADRGGFAVPEGEMERLELGTQTRLLRLCRDIAKEGPQGGSGQRLRGWIVEQLEK